jgi:hypothetical protein
MPMRQLFAVLLLLAGPAALLAEGPAAKPPVVAAVESLGSSGPFAFFADEDASLDHFLYEWARHENRDQKEPFSGRAQIAKLPAAEREAWERAIAFYTKEVISRELGFDSGLADLRFHLLGLDKYGFTGAEPERQAAALVAELLPSYRRVFWPGHLEAARSWVAAYLALPKLAEREKAIAGRIAAAFGGGWPEGLIRVDLSPFASWAGAYTMAYDGAPVSTISSFDPSYQGEAALEMAFHEATHNRLTLGEFRSAVEASFSQKNLTAPPQLVHAIHFYTVGEIARVEAAKLGIAYVPAADQLNLYRGSWAPWREAIGKHWQPHLEGRGERAAAVAALVDQLAAAGKPTPH